MRRLLALGVGCLISASASSEDLLTIFDQAVVNDPLVREAEFTRKATREARPQAWAAYLPQIAGDWSETEDEGSRFSSPERLIDDPTAPPGDPNPVQTIFTQSGSGDSEGEQTNWQVNLRQSIFNWGQLVQLRQAGKVA